MLPGDELVRYSRTSGTTCYNTRLSHTSTPTGFFQSTLAYDSTARRWRLRLKDGTTYRFTAKGLAPVYASASQVAAVYALSDPQLAEIEDRYDNLLTVTRDVTLRVTRITSPNGNWIQFAYADATNTSRVTQAQDHTGRVVGYQYDPLGRLWKVTDPENGIT